MDYQLHHAWANVTKGIRQSWKAGKVLSEGDQQPHKAIYQFADDDVDGAERHYEKALDRYDDALGLIGWNRRLHT